MSCARRTDLVRGLAFFARRDERGTREQLLALAADLGVLTDIEERGWLCRELELDFDTELSNQELVELGIVAGLDFDRCR